MIKDFLDFLGLQEFYSNLKNIFALKSEVKNNQSDWDVTNTSDSAYIKNKPTSLPANGGDANTVSGHTVAVNVPANAKFTDTIYTHPDTDGNKHIPANGNTNSGKYLKATSTAGNYEWGELTKTDVTDALGYTPPTTNTTYGAATSSSSGLMSATDKSKLDGIASGANKTTVDSALSSTSTNPVQNKVINSALAGKAASNHTHSQYVENLSDLGVTATATELNYVDGVTSNIQTQLNAKAVSSHTHKYAGSSSAGGAANSAAKLSTARTISLTGDVTGSTTFDGSGNVSIAVSIAEDSHNHTISNVDGLQDALNEKLESDANAVSASKWSIERNINGMSIDGSANRFNYGTCSTVATTAAKTVACTGFSLATGAEITVRFTVTNTASNPTLNVNNTGAKSIYYNGAAISAGYLKANKTYTFRYNGTQYDLVGDIDTNTTYSLSSFGVTASATELNKLDGVTATATEINYLDGVTSNVQTQLNGKLSTSETAAKATADASGQNIADTYIKALSVNGRTITYTKGDGGTGTITTQDTNTDTKNTTGSTNTSSKIFLVGATSQAANPQTYSHDTAFVGTDGCLYSNSVRVISEVTQSSEPTNQKKGDYWIQEY